MKKQLVLVLMLLMAVTSFAQNGIPHIPKSALQINAGLGLNTYGLPLYTQMDFMVAENITVGPLIGLTLGNDSYASFAGYGDYHFNTLLNIPDNWDVYAGLNIGFKLRFNNQTGTSPLMAGLQIGGRYFWNKIWGINLQLGGGHDYGGRIGITRRF